MQSRAKGPPANFRELNDAQLAELSDEELLAYLLRARAAGRDDAAVTAAQVLAFKHERGLLAWFHNNLGSKGPDVVEELAAVTLRDAILWAPSFQGRSIGQFRAAVFLIARRRRADYLDRKRVDTTPLVYSGEEGEERQLEAPDAIEAIDARGVFNQALDELGKDSHRLVILLHLHGLPYEEIAEKVTGQYSGPDDDPMSENNVAKIVSRFRARVDELMTEADDPTHHA